MGSRRAGAPARVPKPKEPGGVVNAVLLVDHAATCDRRRVVYPWFIQLPLGGVPTDCIEFRDRVGRRREPQNGGCEWITFPCASAGCPARVSIRLAAIERAAERLAKEALE